MPIHKCVFVEKTLLYRVRKLVRAALTLQFKYPNVAGTTPGYCLCKPPALSATEANRDRSKDRRVSKGRKENRSERLSSPSFARLCLLSSCNESRCPPHRRDLMIEIDYISPKAKVIADRQIIFKDPPHCLFSFRSCRAGS